jgi:hypothetical protein
LRFDAALTRYHRRPPEDEELARVGWDAEIDGCGNGRIDRAGDYVEYERRVRGQALGQLARGGVADSEDRSIRCATAVDGDALAARAHSDRAFTAGLDHRAARPVGEAGDRAGARIAGDGEEVDHGARQGELRAAADEYLALDAWVVLVYGRADDRAVGLGQRDFDLALSVLRA